MNTEKTSIKQALKLFGVSRTTLYTYLKKLNILPHKVGRSSYLNEQQIHDIKAFLDSNQATCSPQPEQVGQVEQEIVIKKHYLEKIKMLEISLENEQNKNKQERDENKQLVLQLGQWQGRAKTLEEQNQKLLTLQAPEPQKIGFFQRIFGKK